MPSSTSALPVEDAADFVDRMMKEGTKKAGGGSSRATARMLDENDARQFPSEAKTTDDETAVPMIAANNGKRTASNGKRRIAKGRGGATALALALAAEEEEEEEEEGRDDGDDDGGKRPSSGIRPAKSPLDSKQRGGPPPPPQQHPRREGGARQDRRPDGGAPPPPPPPPPSPPPLDGEHRVQPVIAPRHPVPEREEEEALARAGEEAFEDRERPGVADQPPVARSSRREGRRRRRWPREEEEAGFVRDGGRRRRDAGEVDCSGRGWAGLRRRGGRR